jgi:hypothetical protein
MLPKHNLTCMGASGPIHVRYRTLFDKMGQSLQISHFGEKLELLVRSGKTSFRRVSDIARAIDNIGTDYFSRIKGGSRRVPERVFIKIVELTKESGLIAADWYDDVHTFGNKLGLTLRQIQQITGTVLPGIDFHSRNRDRNNINNIHKLIKGYWESFYYSVSTFDVPRISHDLLIIDDVDDSGFIKCQIIDASFTYTGVCFPIQSNHLYFILEKDGIYDEIIAYMTNRPERTPPILNGVILCSSGGVQDMVPVPCAARVAFRYLGNTQSSIEKVLPHFKLLDGKDLRESLIQSIPSYINPNEINKDHRYYEVKKVIDNEILRDQLPFALRMERKTSN